MNHAERAKQKREVFATLLQEGIAALHLDPRAPGVEVPARFARQPQLLLNFSYRYRLTDFDFDDEVVVATLSFGGQPFFCRIPWYAVFAVSNEPRDKGRVWADDVPPELGGPARAWPDKVPDRPAAPKGKPKLRVLRAVDTAGETADERADDQADNTAHDKADSPAAQTVLAGAAPDAAAGEPRGSGPTPQRAPQPTADEAASAGDRRPSIRRIGLAAASAPPDPADAEADAEAPAPEPPPPPPTRPGGHLRRVK